MAKAKAPSAVPQPDIYDGEPEEVAAEETVVERPQHPAAPKHSSKLVELARDFGLSDAEIDAYEPDRLADLLYHQSKLLARQSRAERQVQTVKETVERTTQPQPAAPPADDLGIDETQFDPTVVALLKKQQARINALEGNQSQFVERENARLTTTNNDVIDAAFEGLGAEYAPFFGDKPAAEMARDDKAFLARLHLLTTSGIDPRNLPSARVVAKKVKAAAEAIYGPLVKAKVPTSAPKPGYEAWLGPEAAAEARQPRKLYRGPDGRILPQAVVDAITKDIEAAQPWATPTARPTQRSQAQEPAGKQKAIRNVAAKLAEMEGGPFEDGGESGYASPDDFV